MEKKKISALKRRRRLIFLLTILGLVFISCWFIFRKKDYTIEYELDNYHITEAFNKEKDYYSFIIKKGEKEYHTILPNSNFISKKLIYKIEELETTEETCVKLYSNKLRFTPLCRKENEQVSYHLVSSEMKQKLGEVFEKIPTTEEDTYKQIKIYNLLYQDYYIWNYRGFIHISDSKQEEINLFTKDIYDPKLVTQVKDYLFIPDYNRDHYFEKVTLINRKTGKQETWNLKNPIYFDSIILGVHEDSIYLVDKHEKIEWSLTPESKEQKKVGSESKIGLTFDGEWKEVSLTKLMNQDNTFSGLYPITYEINNGLYAKMNNASILLSKENVSKLVLQVSDGVFYLDKDTLMKYTDKYGCIKIMNYFEWNFNSNHVIYIF